MADTFQLPIPIDIVNPIANIDARYGPYASVAEACAGVPQALRKIGRTVAVLESGKPVEYCWSAGVTDADLVKKNYTNGDIDEALASKADKSTTYTKNEVDDAIKSSIASVYKVKGNCTNADLPNKATTAKIGYVYNLTDDGNYGKSGDNIVYIGPEGSTAFEAWDNLGGKVDLSGKEDKSNKLTAFQGTPDDEHYISEKLAKTSLDAKFDKANIVTAFQETPDDTHAASEKLTKESLDKKQDTFVVKTYFVRGSAETKIMPIFALPRINDSILIRYTISVNGQSYSDELRYTASYYNNVYDFFTNANVDFVEHRSTVYTPAGVGMYTKHPAAPAKQITITVLSCTCNADDIIWYDNTTAALWDKTTIDRNNATVVSKTDLSNAIDLKTNSNGDIIDSLSNVITELNDNQLYTMNAASSDNAFTIPLRTNYDNTQVFCYGDGTVTYNSINYAYYNGALITLSGSTISISDGTKDYYTKSEVTSMLAAKADDSSVVKSISLNGTTYVPASGVVDLGSTSSVFVIPDVQSPVAGMLGHYYALDRNLYYYNGYNWEMVYSLAQGVASRLATADAPASASNGTIYYDTTEQNLKIWINGGWKNIMEFVHSARQVVYRIGNLPPLTEGLLRVPQQNDYYGGLQVYNGTSWQYIQATADRVFYRSTWVNVSNYTIGVEADGRFKYGYNGVKHILAYLDETHIAQIVAFTDNAGETIAANDVEKIVVTASFGSVSILNFSNITKEDGKTIEINIVANDTISVKDGETTTALTECANTVVRAVCLSNVWHFYRTSDIADYAVPLNYQTLANLVTALSSSSTDTQYPSAKCVFDALSSKADDTAVVHKTGNESVDGWKTLLTGIVIGNSGYIRFAPPGTPGASISCGANNTLTVEGNGIIATSGNILNNENRLVTGGKVYTVLLNYQTLANLVTALSSSSTDTQYPSAKCVYDALTGKANDTAVVHISGEENITGRKNYVSTGIAFTIKRTSDATTNLSLLIDTDGHPNLRRYDNSSVSQNVLLKSDRIEFKDNLSQVNAYVSSNSNLNQDWNTSQLPTKTAVAGYVAGQIAGKADDNSVVHKTGAETIAGVKTFSDGVVLQSSGSISSGSARAVNGGTVFAALSSKANESAVVHNTGDETIAGNKTFSSAVALSASGSIAANNHQAVDGDTVKAYVDSHITDIVITLD